jgi:hypothetical protein
MAAPAAPLEPPKLDPAAPVREPPLVLTAQPPTPSAAISKIEDMAT